MELSTTRSIEAEGILRRVLSAQTATNESWGKWISEQFERDVERWVSEVDCLSMRRAITMLTAGEEHSPDIMSRLHKVAVLAKLLEAQGTPPALREFLVQSTPLPGISPEDPTTFASRLHPNALIVYSRLLDRLDPDEIEIFHDTVRLLSELGLAGLWGNFTAFSSQNPDAGLRQITKELRAGPDDSYEWLRALGAELRFVAQYKAAVLGDWPDQPTLFFCEQSVIRSIVLYKHDAASSYRFDYQAAVYLLDRWADLLRTLEEKGRIQEGTEIGKMIVDRIPLASLTPILCSYGAIAKRHNFEIGYVCDFLERLVQYETYQGLSKRDGISPPCLLIIREMRVRDFRAFGVTGLASGRVQYHYCGARGTLVMTPGEGHLNFQALVPAADLPTELSQLVVSIGVAESEGGWSVPQCFFNSGGDFQNYWYILSSLVDGTIARWSHEFARHCDPVETWTSPLLLQQLYAEANYMMAREWKGKRRPVVLLHIATQALVALVRAEKIDVMCQDRFPVDAPDSKVSVDTSNWCREVHSLVNGICSVLKESNLDGLTDLLVEAVGIPAVAELVVAKKVPRRGLVELASTQFHRVGQLHIEQPLSEMMARATIDKVQLCLRVNAMSVRYDRLLAAVGTWTLDHIARDFPGLLLACEWLDLEDEPAYKPASDERLMRFGRDIAQLARERKKPLTLSEVEALLARKSDYGVPIRVVAVRKLAMALSDKGQDASPMQVLCGLTHFLHLSWGKKLSPVFANILDLLWSKAVAAQGSAASDLRNKINAIYEAE